MKLALALTLLFATCHAQDFYFPDQNGAVKGAQSNAKTPEPEIDAKINDVTESDDKPGTEESASEAPSTTSSPSTSAPSAAPSDHVWILSEKWDNHVGNIISQGITKFTLDMDRAIRNTTLGKNENLLFSPVSLSLTLATVMLASGGRTFDEVSKILGLTTGIDISHHSEVVHQILGLLLDEYERRQKLDETAPRTNIAFGIFVEDGFPVREQFKAVSEEVYSSQITSVDFSSNAKDAKDVINDWVSNKTMGKIANMLQQPPDPSTEVLIASALYFSGEWEQHFMEGGTSKKKFVVSENETVYVDLMANGGFFPFHEDKDLGLKIIGLPYKGNEITMYAVLPTRGKGTASLDELKSHLTPEMIESLIGRMKNSSCIVGLPRMKLSSNLKLRSALEALGLKSLFDPLTADLSVLSPGRNASGAAVTTEASPATTTEKEAETDSMTTTTTGKPSRIPNLSNGGFQPTTASSSSRKKRQSRPIDREFLDFLASRNITNFGVDELRNAPDLSNPGLYADDVLHKVEMTVNERGTEAAAATSTSFDRSNDARRFIANRPFLFFIRHDVGRVIWFWGTINRPTPAYAAP